MKKTVKDVPVAGKRALVRVDFNVPMREGAIADDARIRAALPTIKYLADNGAKVILMSHLGRPEGAPDPKYSLAPVAKRLSELLGKPVLFAASPEVVDDAVKTAVEGMADGKVALLENVRYRKEETKNDPAFSKELAELGDIFVNDAFGTAHRAHSSTAGIADYLPAVSGFLIEKEVQFLGAALDEPERPFVAIMGGAKVSDKISIIENLMEKVDTLIIGGAMMFTFYKALGYETGKSIVDEDHIELAKSFIDRAKERGVKLMLPVDVKLASEFANDAEIAVADADKIPEDMMGMDIGPKTIKLYCDEIAKAKTVVWNGPMGVFEMPNFADGTRAVAEAMAKSGAVTVVGGGDSSEAISQFGFDKDMTHISTGGGASLEYLEGKILPGIACLQDK